MSKLREIEIGNKYHIYSRGVNRREIFTEHFDYLKFINMIFKFSIIQKNKPYSDLIIDKKLVKIECFTLMPNHFHMILEELVEGGISLFVQRILTGYAIYYNKKYNRVGALFGSRFKDKIVDTNDYDAILKSYIWHNPLKNIRKDYKHIDIINGVLIPTKYEKEYLKNYPYKYFNSSNQSKRSDLI